MVSINGLFVDNLDLLFLGALIIAATVISQLAFYLIQRILPQERRKAVSALKLPIFLVLLLIAIYLSINRVPALAPYASTIGKLFITALAFELAFLLIRVSDSLSRWYMMQAEALEAEGLSKALPILNIGFKVFVLLIAATVSFSAFGVDVTPLVASLGLLGLSVSLALQGPVADVFSGLYLLLEKPLRVKNYVRLENGIEGTVVAVNWKNTIIVTRDGQNVFVPNSKLVQMVVSMVPTGPKIEFKISLAVKADSDLSKAEGSAIEVAKKVVVKVAEGKGHKPRILFEKVSDNGVEFSVVMQADSHSERVELTHEFIKAITKRFRKDKIEFQSTMRDIRISGLK